MALDLTTRNATISRITEKGFQVKEQPGKTFVVSQYATPPPTIPPVGTEVELGLDTRGFCYAIKPWVDPAVKAEPAPAPADPPTPAFSVQRAELYLMALGAAAACANPGDFEAAEYKAEQWLKKAIAFGTKKEAK